MKRLGLIINPIAGMGGSVGLKGTDGVFDEAVKRGAVPHAGEKTARALKQLLPIQNELTVLTAGGAMGADILSELGFSHRTIYGPDAFPGAPKDTRAAAEAALDEGADIIAFAGGDGTARDICEAVGERVPVLGIPAGVKIHSPVYAQTPEKAGELLHLFLTGRTELTREAEVLDIDEEDYRNGIINTRLYGYLSTPFERRFMQAGKAPSPASEKSRQFSIAAAIMDDMDVDTYYLVGPGSTTRALMEALGVANTLLGVDVVKNRETIAADVTEKEILTYLEKGPAKMIITPTGGQGYLLGRGNQQISPDVIKKLGKQNIITAATTAKLSTLKGEPLHVDTGDPQADEILRGYIKIVTGYREITMYHVE